MAITVNSITNPAHASDPYYEAMGHWVFAEFTVVNEASKKLDFNRNYLRLLADDGTEVSQNLGFVHQPVLPQYPTMAPGEEIRGFLVFLVPRNSREKALIYHPSGIQRFTLAVFPP